MKTAEDACADDVLLKFDEGQLNEKSQEIRLVRSPKWGQFLVIICQFRHWTGYDV